MFGLHCVYFVKIVCLLSKNLNYIVICPCGKQDQNVTQMDGARASCFVFHQLRKICYSFPINNSSKNVKLPFVSKSHILGYMQVIYFSEQQTPLEMLGPGPPDARMSEVQGAV